MVEKYRRLSRASWGSKVIEEVREALDPIAYISVYTPLRRSGKGFVGLCPFHREKTPSFHVSPEGLFYCFGCKASGDIFRFIELKEGVSFSEAVAIAAEFAGVVLEEKYILQQGKEVSYSRSEGYDLLAKVAEFYTRIFAKEEIAAPARSYLRKRGYPETFWEGRFAYADEEKAPLKKFLNQIGASPELAQAVGLLNAAGNERFSRRLLFPIHDDRGKVCGFGARSLFPGDEPKYLNSPDSPWFHKGQLLYGFFQTLPYVRTERTLILCEGYFDALRFHLLGIPLAVAPLGTALTSRQSVQLASRAQRVILAFDRDEAGARAAFRAFLLLFERGIEVRTLRWEKGKDPDEYLKDYSDAQARELIASSPEYFPLFLEDLKQVMTTLLKRRGISEWITRELAELKDPLCLDLLLRELSPVLEVSVDALKEKVERLKSREPKSPAFTEVPATIPPPTQSEEILVQLLFRENINRFEIMDSLKDVPLHPWIEVLIRGGDLEDPAYRSWLARMRHREPPRLKPDGIPLLMKEIRIASEERFHHLRVRELEARLRDSLTGGESHGIEAALKASRSESEGKSCG